ncbi:MAG: hypothetical protein ACTHMS_16450, partial [Jatrophihabitans sp.]
ALDRTPHVGDLVLLGRVDPDTDEVAAFEELVGSHGGLGADQTEAVLVVPTAWPAITPSSPGAPLTGVDVFGALVGRLEQLGLRSSGTASRLPVDA